MRFYLPVLIVCLLALAACAGGAASKSVSYTLPDTPGGRLCTSQCGKARDYCREDCELHQHECASRVQRQALIDYQKYMSEQFMHNDTVELRARDFERLEPCDDNFKSCAGVCDNDYQGCYQNCGGKIGITTSCQFMCF